MSVSLYVVDVDTVMQNYLVIRGESTHKVSSSASVQKTVARTEISALTGNFKSVAVIGSNAGEDAAELVYAAERRSCKVLILTRPYNLQQIRAKVDCQFECLGFNDRQLMNYIHRELQQDDASRLVLSLQQDRGMWETAHIPVTAHILCSLSKEHGTAVEDRGKRASMFQIYCDMTNFVWKRFEDKPTAINANKMAIFGDLEKIAFDALRKRQILIEQRIVERCATSTNASKFFKESGFLLLVLEGQQYQFPHLTFQEYFAGKFIARSLKNKGSDEETRVKKFIQEGKYNRKNALTISFAMHALAQKRGKNALTQMLSIVDENPVEVLGVQHFFLRMRVLEATLEETDEDDLEDLLNDEPAKKLAESARQLLERSGNDVLIHKIVVEEFRRLSCVLKRFPKVLDDTTEEVKRILESSDDLTWKMMTRIEDALKLARHSPKQSYMIIQFVLQLAEEPGSQCNPKECIRRLSFVAEQMPQHVGEVLLSLAKRCVDEDFFVRQRALEAIGSLVKAAPQHTDGILSAMAKRCTDEDLLVRQRTMKAIGHVVAAAPERAGEVLPALTNGSVDKDLDVRRTAIEAIGTFVAAAPEHAGEVLPALANGCVDEDSGLRCSANTALNSIKPEKIVISSVSILPVHRSGLLFVFVQHHFTFDTSTNCETVPLILHTTLSRQIGKSSKADANLYVGFLKREFEEKFHGLLENIQKTGLKYTLSFVCP